jgi:hypothetical protein
MARGRYMETETGRALRSIIAFAEADVPIPARTARKVRGARRDLLNLMAAGDALPGGAPLTAIANMNVVGLEQLRLRLRAFLRYLAGKDDAWPLPGEPADMKIQSTPVRVTSGAIKWHIQPALGGTEGDVLIHQTKSLLDRLGGLDRLRLCPAPDCGRVYLKIGRRENCSTRCQQRLYQRSYDPFAARARRSDRSLIVRQRRRGG